MTAATDVLANYPFDKEYYERKQKQRECDRKQQEKEKEKKRKEKRQRKWGTTCTTRRILLSLLW